MGERHARGRRWKGWRVDDVVHWVNNIKAGRLPALVGPNAAKTLKNCISGIF